MIKKCKCGYSYETTWQSKPTYMYKRERKNRTTVYRAYKAAINTIEEKGGDAAKARERYEMLRNHYA